MTKLSNVVAVLVLIIITGISGFAQEQPTAKQQDNGLIGHYSRAYLLAQRYGDTNNAITAVYNVLAEYPQNDSLLFTLSYLYFQDGRYASSVLVSNDLLKINPEHTGALEISGAGYEKLGIKDKALDAFESLYLKSNDFQTLYKVAFLQYDLKRYTECATNTDILLKKPEAETLNVFYSDENNKEQQYPIKVAIYNLQGMVSKAQGDKVNAKKHFEAALAISPNFNIAKKGLEELK